MTADLRRSIRAAAALCVLLFALAPQSSAQAIDYQRPVDTAPQEKSIGGGYITPQVQKPQPRSYWREVGDVILLAASMSVSVWIVLRRRSRRLLVTLALGNLAYFGFYREGCVCPVGSIQNVALALWDPGYRIPIVVIAVFFLPLAAALLFGRVYCGGVCPLGAIQEIVLLRPIRIPARLDRILGLLKYAYLGLAIWFAVQPIAQREFMICRFDPFVGFFRRTGFAHMMGIGALFVVAGMFVGRPYCRYLCPYGGLLAWLSRLAPRGVTITPGEELDCGLCRDACPYGAIENMRAVRKNCLFCARCYASCPKDGPRARHDSLTQIGAAS